MYVETSAMTGSGVTDLFKSIGVCIGWRLGVALKVRESMETNAKTGFQLLEVKNETPDKVLEVKWRVTGRVLDGGKKSGGCCKWLVCCKHLHNNNTNKTVCYKHRKTTTAQPPQMPSFPCLHAALGLKMGMYFSILPRCFCTMHSQIQVRLRISCNFRWQ